MKDRLSCPSCHREFDIELLKNYMMVCPKCNYHHRICPKERIAQIADQDTFKEFIDDFSYSNPIELEGYDEKLAQNRDKSSINEAVVTGKCEIDHQKAVLAVMSFDFMGGSMGTVVGEKITNAMIEGAIDGVPVIIFSASGGARMQEGMYSLIQMARTSAAIGKYQNAGGLYISVLTHPTTGGVSASFAFLGDIIIAEPVALIGFAGPRVIEQTTKQKLPSGFQTSEFLLQHGQIDKIVKRKQLRHCISSLLEFYKKGKQI